MLKGKKVQSAIGTLMMLAALQSMTILQVRMAERLVRRLLQDVSLALYRSGLHFIRCIKPNDEARPGVIGQAVMLSQLQCCGVMEVTRVAKAGYPSRLSFQEFLSLLQPLLPSWGKPT